MLDTPVKNEETYDISSVPMYIGHKSFRSEKHENNPNHALRRTQVNEIASMILHQISRMGQWLQIVMMTWTMGMLVLPWTTHSSTSRPHSRSSTTLCCSPMPKRQPGDNNSRPGSPRTQITVPA